MVALNGIGTGGDNFVAARIGSSPNTTAARAISPAATVIRISTRSQRVMPTSSRGTSIEASTNTSEPAQNTNCSQSSCRKRQVCGLSVDGP